MVGDGLRGLGRGVRERVCNRLWRAGASEASPQSRQGDRGRAAGPAAEPPTRAQPMCFAVGETACGRMPAACRKPLGMFLWFFYRFGVELRSAEGRPDKAAEWGFYFCGRSRTAMVSMWSVWGNMSTGWRRVTR